MNLLRPGNSKLSQAIWTWGLPAIVTCPGRSTGSKGCEKRCYATRGRYHYPSVKLRLQRSYEASLRPDFVARMVEEIRRRGSSFIVRIHDSGDFYSSEYIEKWIEIARACRRRTRFYAYTRSWREAEFKRSLQQLAKLKNVRLWWSADEETGLPADPSWAKLGKVAWLETVESDPPATLDSVGVIFRDYPLRKVRPARVSLSLVCPHELPKGDQINCGNCGRCWD